MKKIESALAWIQVVLFAIFTALFQVIKDVISSKLGDTARNVGAIVLVIVAFRVFSNALSSAVSHITWLRRLLAGSEWVEGEWIHTVRDSEGRLVSTGMVRIDYLAGRLFVSGEAWTKRGYLTNFSSELSVFADFVLTFTYAQLGTMAATSGFETGIVGFGRYRFTPRGFVAPNACDGFFFDGSCGKVYRLTGRKLGHGDLLPQDDPGKQRLAQTNLDAAAVMGQPTTAPTPWRSQLEAVHDVK